MKLEIDHSELLLILTNQGIILEALTSVSVAAGVDITTLVTSVPRAMELIQQSVKSTYSVVNEVRSRNELHSA